MKKRYLGIILLFAILFSLQITGYAKEYEQTFDVIYFYMNACESCTDSDEIINHYYSMAENENIKMNLYSYNIFKSQALQVYKSYMSYYEASDQQKVPLVIIDGKVHSGESDIEEALESTFMRIKRGDTIKSSRMNAPQSQVEKPVVTPLKIITFGLVNGLNPCSISMFLFLVSLILSEKRKAAFMGLGFIIGKFVTYILLGSILTTLVSSPGFVSILHIVKVIVALILGVLAFLNFYDAYTLIFHKNRSIKNQLPSSLRGKLHQLIKITTTKSSKLYLPMGLLLGSLLSLGEFMCTGQVMLASIFYFTQSSFSFIYIVIYAFAFILPLMILWLAILFIGDLLNLTIFIQRKEKYIKVLTGLLLGLMIILLFI